MKEFDTVIWVSDCSLTSGEGVLANKFIDILYKSKKFKKALIKNFESEFYYSKKDIKNPVRIKNNFIHKYIAPFYGVYFLSKYASRKKIIYVNYLPLWNFFIFLLLPKKTILGPITGGSYEGPVTNINLFIRKYIFPFFCRFSLKIIYKKYNNFFFSTELCKKYVDRKFYKKTLFNFIFIFFNRTYKKKKIIYDAVFYNRNHPLKKAKILLKILVNLENKFNICIFGDYLNKFKNLGFISKNKVLDLLNKTKIAFSSSENLFSLFSIECLNNRVFIFYDKTIHVNLNYKSKYFIPVNYENIETVKKEINILAKKANDAVNDSVFENYVKNKKKEINNFIKNL
jgi:hypothetical protein